jgi:hypothetical protein
LNIDIKKVSDADGKYEYTLKRRTDSNKRNMRLSFQPRKDDPNTADWVVYHAKGQDVREEVTLRNSKDNNGDSPMQVFYSFQGGNLGRSGRNFMELPVIEHGFWDVSPNGSGERRTVVLVYNPQSGHLMKVCYLQQKKKMGKSAIDFDVSGIDRRDIRIMPKNPKLSLKCARRKWLHSPKSKYAEVLGVQKYRYKREDASDNETTDTLLSLFDSRSRNKKDDNMIHLSLPNGVILACPLSIKSSDGSAMVESFGIAMGFQNSAGTVQVIDFGFEEGKLKQVKGCTIEV